MRHETDLSPRELEVIGYVAQGYRPKEIAALICRSDKTVDTHIQRVRYKLGRPSGVEWMRFLRTFPGPAPV